MSSGNRSLINARVRVGKTQEQIEAETGLSQALLSLLEKGHCPESVAKAVALARALGSSVESLFGHLVPPRIEKRKRKPRSLTAKSDPNEKAA